MTGDAGPPASPGVVHHRVAEVEGHAIFYREAGPPAGPHVVLLHGAPASSSMFRHLIPLLADRYHVIAPDLLGFGHSARPPVEQFAYTFDALARLTGGLLDGLGIRRFAMYVQDYGAPVGWRLALGDEHAITGVVTQNGNAYEEGFVTPFWEPLWAYAANPNARTEAPLRASLELDAIRWQYTHGVPDITLIDPDAWQHDHAMVSRPGNAEVQLALYADYPSNVALYDDVHRWFADRHVPLLAAWGANDEIFSPDGARAFRRDLPEAEIHLLDAGHFALESELGTIAQLMRTFLAVPALNRS
jgi:pimeloyl-ACP methyl ester carboxylesterase